MLGTILGTVQRSAHFTDEETVTQETKQLAKSLSQRQARRISAMEEAGFKQLLHQIWGSQLTDPPGDPHARLGCPCA